MKDFLLRTDEYILEETKGDLWEGFIIFLQRRGSYIFTNQRAIFFPATLFGTSTSIGFDYKDIILIKKCLIGPLIPFLPFGVKVKTKNRKTYRLSLIGRSKYIDLIENNRL